MFFQVILHPVYGKLVNKLFFRKQEAFVRPSAKFLITQTVVKKNRVPVFFVHMIGGKKFLPVEQFFHIFGTASQIEDFRCRGIAQTGTAGGNG